MSKSWAAICLMSLCAGLAGCGGKEYEGDQRFPLSGKVTVDGEPMQYGVISFLPQDKAGRVSGAPIRDGAYSVPEARGATAGTYRVEMHWNKLTGKKIPNPMDKEEMIDELEEGLPPELQKDPERTVQVGPDQTTFDFNLTTKD